MSLGLFTTILTRAEKTGNLVLWNKVTQTAQEAIFTRSTPNGQSFNGAYRVNSNGFLEELYTDQPNWTYPIGGSASGDASLSFSKSGTQLLSHGKDLTNAMWLNNDLTVTSGITDIYNTSNAIRLTESGAGSNSAFQATVTGVSGNEYATGFWIKGISNFNDNISLRCAVLASVDIVVTSDWKFHEITNTADSTTIRSGIVLDANSGAIIEVCFPILNEGELTIEHIPTTGSTASRSQDIATFTDLVDNKVFSPNSVGSVYMKLKSYKSYSTPLSYPFNDSSGVNLFSYVMRSYGATPFRYYYVDDNVGTTNDGALDENEPYIITFNGQNVKIYQPSGLVQEYTSKILGNEIDQFNVPSTPNGTIEYEQIAFSPIALTEAEAIAALN